MGKKSTESIADDVERTIEEVETVTDQTEKEDTIEKDIEARVEAILAKAQQKADEILANAQKAANQVSAAPDYNPADYKDLEEYVTVRLFKDNNKYKDDVFVSVNGENCQIQRGKDVRIKRKFAMILEQSLRQDEFAASYSDSLQNEYAEKEKAGKL